MRKPELSHGQLRAIGCILECNSLERAARKARVSRTSIYNWLKDRNFKERLETEREALFLEGLDMLKQATLAAVDKLINLLESKDETIVRLVAKDIINISLRSAEIRDLQERVSKIEQALVQRPMIGKGKVYYPKV